MGHNLAHMWLLVSVSWRRYFLGDNFLYRALYCVDKPAQLVSVSDAFWKINTMSPISSTEAKRH